MIKQGYPEYELRDTLARRYNYKSPFDPDLIKDLQHPVRREFLIAGLMYLKKEEDLIIESLCKHLPESIKDIMNIVGTAIVNTQGRRLKQPMKSLFILADDEIKNLIIKTPDGKEVILVE